MALPDAVTVIRGNHESEYCTSAYGFRNELSTKYGEEPARGVYTSCLHLFANLPLAAVLDDSVLVLHGGLFRKPVTRRKKVRDIFSLRRVNLRYTERNAINSMSYNYVGFTDCKLRRTRNLFCSGVLKGNTPPPEGPPHVSSHR